MIFMYNLSLSLPLSLYMCIYIYIYSHLRRHRSGQSEICSTITNTSRRRPPRRATGYDGDIFWGAASFSPRSPCVQCLLALHSVSVFPLLWYPAGGNTQGHLM